MINLLTELLGIPSPTFQEARKSDFIQKYLQQQRPDLKIMKVKESIIATADNRATNKPHILLVGHIDVVPAHFAPYEKDGKLFGAGASDMQGGLAALLDFIAHVDPDKSVYQFSLIAYAREEGTTLKENGLYELIEKHSDFFKTVDLAIIGEPTNNTIQLGCLGSLHAEVIFRGRQSHSARPWDGENALYRAIPFIQKIAALQPVKKEIAQVNFFDVVTLTESESEHGTTTIPGWWRGHLNYRYAPDVAADAAENFVHKLVEEFRCELTILDNAPSGQIIETDLFNKIIKKMNVAVQAKQAWTDVAQLTLLGIPAFNYGPGLTAQAHRPDEHIVLDNVKGYCAQLKEALA